MNLELFAMVWLRTEKRCMIVTRERCLRWACGQPDVLGITEARYMIEIEIKRSVSDFRADASKASRRNRDLYPAKMPKQFYYLMPRKVATKVVGEIPEWAGWMTVEEDGYGVTVVKKAPVNHQSQKVSMAECVRAVCHQTNFVLSLERDNHTWRQRFIDGHTPYLGWDTTIPHYEI